MDINNNLSGGIKQRNPIETMSNSDKINGLNVGQYQQYKKEETLKKVTEHKTTKQLKTMTNDSKYIRMDNFLMPKLSNFPTIEEIKKQLIASKKTTGDTSDEDEGSEFIKVVTMAPGFVYGVDTREYHPKKNVQVGPSISDMSG
jgi:hypothetical protein